MELNTTILGDCIEKMRDIESGSVDLVIADPPYWKVVNEQWDNKWKDRCDYIEWSLKWIGEVSRILRYGGTFYCFGYFRTLAYIVPYLEDMGLEVRQQIVIDKGMRAVAGRTTKKLKMYPTATESILFAIKDNKKFIKPFLKERQKTLGLTSKQINDAIGVKSNGGGMWSQYTGNTVSGEFPTEELWNKLSDVLKFNLPYKSVSQTFNPQMGYTDVWTDIDFYKEKRYHPTQKPLKLINRLILTSSNEGDLVVDPFAGCGSTQLSAIQLNRNYIGIELNEDYYDISLKRINELIS